MAKRFDIVIIGAGLTGGLAAEYLSRSGKSVCILERGGDYLPDRRNHWIEIHYPVPDSQRWVTVAKDDPYERVEIKALGPSDDSLFRYNMKFGVGGSGAVWSGAAFRFRPDDFRLRTRHGVGEDWPITYDDLEPWYCMAEKELGVSGSDPQALWPRQCDFPMPPFRQSYLDRIFEKYYGSVFPLMPLPCAVASEQYNGRGPCNGSRSCVSFCPTEARYHPLQNHLGEAIRRPNCKLIKRAIVTRLHTQKDTGRIASVTVLRENAKPVNIQGDLFILAANAVENTRLLLASANADFPDGLANTSGLLGKYFMSTGIYAGRIEFPEFTFPNRGRPITSVCARYSNGPHRGKMASFLVEIWNDVWSLGHLNHYLNQQVLGSQWGSTLKKHVETYLRTVDFSIPFEILPRIDNTLTLDPDEMDAFGLPLPVSRIHLGDYEFRVKEFVGNQLARRSPSIRAAITETGINGNHPFGVYRMARKPMDGVVDANLKSFDHENLHILGGGSFVTGTCFNPTLSIAALTLKSVHSIKM